MDYELEARSGGEMATEVRVGREEATSAGFSAGFTSVEREFPDPVEQGSDLIHPDPFSRTGQESAVQSWPGA